MDQPTNLENLALGREQNIENIDAANVVDLFMPHRLLRNHTLQTVVSTWKPSSVNWLLTEEQPVLIDAGEDQTGYDLDRTVQLLAYYSPARPNGPSTGNPVDKDDNNGRRGLVLMLHGWRGCSHSPYNLMVTDRLVRSGFDVMRLNLRDHGPSIHVGAHQLNRGAFLGTLIEEAEAATHRIAKMAGDLPFFIVGPSMGGNFALRLALQHAQRPIHNLRHVVAICPAIDPASATDALDANYIYRQYFRRQWLLGLRTKIAAFPETFHILRGIEDYHTVRAMTEWAIPQISQWSGADEYFYNYGVCPESIHRLNVNTTIITAKDDPVIPASDFEALPTNPFLTVRVTNYGGHVGYMDLTIRNGMPQVVHKLPEMILATIEEHV